jgi:hypothetical protein
MFAIDLAQLLFREIDERVELIDDQILRGYAELLPYREAVARRRGMIEVRDLIRSALSERDKKSIDHQA